MSRYDATDDPLFYPGSQVLKNIAGLTEQDELDQFEQLMFLTRADETLPIGDLDYNHYKAIHRHFFQDVYDWAGKPREIRTGKGGNWFCFPEYIDAEMEKIFSELASESHLTQIADLEVFAGRASHYISEINAIHPFREGNGRCQLTFLSFLMEISGFEMNEESCGALAVAVSWCAGLYAGSEPMSFGRANRRSIFICRFSTRSGKQDAATVLNSGDD